MNMNLLLSPIMAVDLEKALTSATAIIVYVVLIFILILVLVCIIMANEKRRVDDEEAIIKNKTDRDAEIVVQELTKVINKRIDALQYSIASSDEKIETILRRNVFNTTQ